jgi:Uma2 family endonuclease
MPTSVETPVALNTQERHVLLEGISWQRFEQISACFEDSRAVRLTYIAGDLEIMSPIGEQHEALKSNLSILLESYLELKSVRFYRRGGFTLREPGLSAGEPDESYCIGSNKLIPDLVIEVVVTNPVLSKLPLYRAKQIPEVWIWEQDALRIWTLEEGNYRESRVSGLFPTLDVEIFMRHVRMPDQYDAVRAFRRIIFSE